LSGRALLYNEGPVRDVTVPVGDVTRDDLLSVVSDRDAMLHDFWTTWKDVYLTSLLERGRRSSGHQYNRPKVNDVVLLQD
jgi:hypothetical protein